MVSCALHLRKLIDHYISLFLYDVAKFYAERLYCEERNQSSAYLLALCFFRQGKTKQAYLILNGASNSLENLYLLAQCCVSLDKLNEAEKALTVHLHDSRPQRINHDTIQKIPGGPAGLYLLGYIHMRENRRDSAIMYLKVCLKVNLY